VSKLAQNEEEIGKLRTQRDSLVWDAIPDVKGIEEQIASAHIKKD
jgi:hypothetical protein